LADAKLRQAQAYLDRLQAEYGLEALTSLEQKRRTMRGFKVAKVISSGCWRHITDERTTKVEL